MNTPEKLIASVRRQLFALALLRCVLLAAAATVGASALTSTPVVVACWGMAALGAGIVLTRLLHPKNQEAYAFIHQKIPGAEYSLALLDRPALNLAERLQLERIGLQLQNQSPPRVSFRPLWPYVLAMLAAFAVRAILLHPVEKELSNRFIKIHSDPKRPAGKALPPALQTATLYVQPPPYSGLPPTESADLNISALSGSRLTWRVTMQHTEGIVLRLSDGRGPGNLFQQKDTGVYSYTDRLLHSGLYALKAYRSDSLVWQSEFYRLEAQVDAPPRISPASKELYRYHQLNDTPKLTVSARIEDDFRVQQAYIVATLARGSGENVKFRELRLPLGSGSFKDASLTKVLDLKALDFTPGDELYYYWAAVDNRQPEANFSKSDTYFIVYRDTTQLEESALATMAVNRMPEYFRSQRQIVIDTEKLIARRRKLPPKEFNATSNEIGFDQKVLRLRYGQFMGEEFETSIGGGGGPTEGDASLEGFMHKHDTEDEHAAEAETAPHDHEPGHDHDHDHGPAAPADQQDPLAALMEQYIHAHDDGEINTFYEQSTRSLLKMALEQMWQSELHLRLYEPEKALPFELKALEYLKTAQQKARTYAKKSGFDPPPLKLNETRLTGELDKINSRHQRERTYSGKTLAAQAARLLGYLERTKLTAAQRNDVQQTVSQLSATTAPAASGAQKNWTVLSDLQKLASGRPLSTPEKTRTRAYLLKLAPPTWQTTSPHPGSSALEAAFWRELL